jgi:hypothetical protein
MSRQRWWAAVAIVAGVLATLTGCAKFTPLPASPGAPAADYLDGPYGGPCDATVPFGESTPPMEPLPAGAALVSATRCIYETERVPGDGEWSVRIDQEATTGLDRLAAALATPSETAGAGQICPLIAYAPIIITVTDGTGRQFHPEIPTTACGAPMKFATDAIVALPWTTVARARVAPARSELEITSGCAGGYKAMVALVAAEGTTGAQRFPLDTTPRPLSLCRFAVPPEAVEYAARGELYGGDLVAASTLEPAAAGELLTAVDGAPSGAPECTEPSSFVVISEADGRQMELMVEVDGCYRAMVGSDVRQLDPGLVILLLG